MTDHRMTYALLLGTMFFWGGTWIAGRVVGETLQPMTAALLRFTVASLALVGLCVRRDGRFGRLPRSLFGPMTALGLTGVVSYSWFFFAGLQRTTSARAALIVATTPVAIVVTSALVRRERLGLRQWTGVLLALVGVSVVIAEGSPLVLLDEGLGRGEVLIFGCVFSWTAYTLIGRGLADRVDALVATTWSSIVGAVVLLPLALLGGFVEDVRDIRWSDVAWIVYMGALATALAYSWYQQGIRDLGPPRAGVFINTVPLFAVLLAWLILGERIHPAALLGGPLVVVGVLLANGLGSGVRRGRAGPTR